MHKWNLILQTPNIKHEEKEEKNDPRKREENRKKINIHRKILFSKKKKNTYESCDI